MNQEIQFFNGLVSEPSVDIMKSYKGTGGASKMDEFSEKFQKGWGEGVIFNSKIYVAVFLPLNRDFWAWNW